MPRIKLAYWAGDHKPGDEIDVTDTELAALTRDGRVAEVLQDPAGPPAVQPTAEVQPEPVADAGRKRR